MQASAEAVQARRIAIGSSLVIAVTIAPPCSCDVLAFGLAFDAGELLASKIVSG
jgi:hypothetical protein